MPCNLCGKWNCVCQYSQPKQQQDFTSCFFSREAMKEHSDFHPQPKAKQDEPVFHLKQYGDVTKEQLDRYIATGDINQQPKQEQGEPVAWMLNNAFYKVKQTKMNGSFWENQIPLYTHPQPREWVGLTDEEILEVNMSTVTKLIDEPIVCDTDHNIIQLGKAIEAKLKEKNNE